MGYEQPIGSTAMRPFPLICLACTALLAAMLPAAAAEPTVPRMFDPAERLSAPAIEGIERIRFVTGSDFPPLNQIGPGGTLSGYNVDLAREICRVLGLLDRCQIQGLPFGEVAAAVTSGAAEAAIAGLAITPQSRSQFDFSRPYLPLPARFVMRQDRTAGLVLPDGVDDRRIGAIAGSAHERMLRDLFPATKVVAYDREAWIFDDLAAGRIDGAFGDGMHLAQWLGGGGAACCRFVGGPYLAPEYLGYGLAIATAKDRPDLVASFDYALRELERRGITGELYLRYFPVGFF